MKIIRVLMPLFLSIIEMVLNSLSGKGEYAYLVDKQVGYTNHMRVDNNVKAKLVACAGEIAYRKSAQKVAQECGGVTVSGQTVLRAVREFEQPINPKPDERKRVKTLYIEADEDHAASQHGRAMEVRLVYYS